MLEKFGELRDDSKNETVIRIEENTSEIRGNPDGVMPNSPSVKRLISLGAAGMVLAAGVLVGSGGPDLRFGKVREAELVTSGRIDLGLSQVLAGLHRTAQIRPDQEAAWSSFMAAMLELERLTRAFEQRTAPDDANALEERARHALMFGAAIGEIEDVLSEQQSAVLRGLTDRLSRSFVCQGVAGKLTQ
jgi:hypothetical protein